MSNEKENKDQRIASQNTQAQQKMSQYIPPWEVEEILAAELGNLNAAASSPVPK